ncbi:MULTISPECIES: helix-turn-helix domain-containing protein [Clostridia]|uniref:helix-turn-helix domain-containing protein n=1 Tax=Clostridia TaxID=186801 RepID=UPI000EA37A53|nr:MULTISPECIES: helix-turn-helix domain-containing protein [Clostridia]NBJ71035.1 DNA-binding protein [Roseburia sp. 1XD42-34]RKI75469.1 DNA-binding protein [Clostridium sp. 1xD42-85]
MTKSKYCFDNVDQLRSFLENEVVTTTEAVELIGCSRQNIKQLVDHGTLMPIKQTPRERLFLKEDVLNYRKRK